MFGALLLGALIGAIMAARSGRHVDRADPQAWQVVVAVICVCLAVVAFVWVVVVQIRSGMWGGLGRSPLVALTHRQRKELYAQVRGKRPADPARLPLSRYVARRLLLGEGTIVALAGLMLLWFGRAVVIPDRVHPVRLACLLVLGGVGILLMVRRTRRARRFLEATSSQAADDQVA